MIAARRGQRSKPGARSPIFYAKRPAGGRERGAPVGAQGRLTSTSAFRPEHPLGLFADGPRNPALPISISHRAHPLQAVQALSCSPRRRDQPMLRRLSVAMVTMMLFSAGAGAQAPAQQAASEPKTVWFFYTVKWGFQDEVPDFFQRNHYPILREYGRRPASTSRSKYVRAREPRRRPLRLDVRRRARRTGQAALRHRPEEEIVAKLYPDLAKLQERGTATVRAARCALGRPRSTGSTWSTRKPTR